MIEHVASFRDATALDLSREDDMCRRTACNVLLAAGVTIGTHEALERVMKLSIAILVAAFVGLYTIFAKEDARYERAIARTVEPDGCHNEARGADFNALGGIILFERYCRDSVRRTMNASFIPNHSEDSVFRMPRGPGNVLVLELREIRTRRAFYAGMYGEYGRNGRFVIRYDSTARVISQHPTVDGVTFEFVPTAVP